MATPFLLDCDTGIDDSLAILYLLADPAADLIAITNTFGNVAVDQTTANTLALLQLAGRADIPVSTGAAHPLHGEFDGGAPQVHGGNGIGDVQLPAADRAATAEFAPDTIVRLARQYAGDLHLIAVGPFTNLALALDRCPELPELISHVTVMGGAAAAPGNVSAVAEANIWNDPAAAAAVFSASWEITMVGLDVTMEERFTEPDRQQLLGATNPASRAVGEMLDCYLNFYEPILGMRGCALHDPLAAAIATGSAAMTTAPIVRVAVDDTDGPGRGQTIADLRGKYSGFPAQRDGRCRVALEMAEPFAPLLLDRLLSL